eukprot:TRINITY_DN9419_c0_g1_i1.p1 TRINITY_DN9419_c0_g1~~TRINITY_DN9419_c0_g1_i1.p1  ORF type:complete len:349 (+),score=53.76 TRINITY_DN9419_c0_g1_i1:66-1049(+)
MSYQMSGVQIGRDAMAVIFSILLRQMYSVWNANKRIFARWRRLSLVSKEWNDLAWNLLDVSIQNNYPIRLAARAGSVQSINKIMMDPRCDPSGALVEAVKGGHLIVVEELMKNPKVDASIDANICAREAARLGHVDIMKLLQRDKRVDFTACNNSAMRKAVEYGHPDVIRFLLSDPKFWNHNGDRGLLPFYALNRMIAGDLKKETVMEMMEILCENGRMQIGYSQLTNFAYHDIDLFSLFMRKHHLSLIDWIGLLIVIISFEKNLVESVAIIIEDERCLASIARATKDQIDLLFERFHSFPKDLQLLYQNHPSIGPLLANYLSNTQS